MKICSRCIYDERTAYITFDDDGVCNYCHQIDVLTKEYGTASEKGGKKFYKIIEEIKKAKRNEV